MCYECCSQQVRNSIGRSGSVDEETRYEGDSADDEKFEGDRSSSGNNPNIGETGWGS